MSLTFLSFMFMRLNWLIFSLDNLFIIVSSTAYIIFQVHLESNESKKALFMLNCLETLIFHQNFLILQTHHSHITTIHAPVFKSILMIFFLLPALFAGPCSSFPPFLYYYSCWKIFHFQYCFDFQFLALFDDFL